MVARKRVLVCILKTCVSIAKTQIMSAVNTQQKYFSISLRYLLRATCASSSIAHAMPLDLSLEIVVFLKCIAYKWNMNNACVAGERHLRVIQRLHHANAKCSTIAMDFAANHGRLQIVQWLHANRTEGCTYCAMDFAAEEGHLHVVQWLHENRTEGCTTRAMDLAKKQGHAHVVRWLRENVSSFAS
jgi:hypothetical protein